MTVYNDNDNEFNLSPEERRVLYHWQQGDSMTDAYKKVMLTVYDEQAISSTALKKRVIRFFNTYRMRASMAATPGYRGEQAKKDLERWQESLRGKAMRQYMKLQKEQDAEDKDEAPNGVIDTQVEEKVDTQVEERIEAQIEEPQQEQVIVPVQEEQERQEEVNQNKSSRKRNTPAKSDKDKWLDSLNVNENPSSMTIYGTGQFLAYMAVKEIMARQAEIKIQGISPLDKNGSALTPTIISALKTAAAMLLPFAPAPSADDRREMSKAAVLLGLVPDNIHESPDEYTAPMPNAIEVTQDE